MTQFSAPAWILGEHVDAMPALRSAGFDAVELDAVSGFDPFAARKQAEAHGLAVGVLCAEYTVDRDFASLDPGTRRAASDHLQRTLEWAEIVGAEGIIVVPTFMTEPPREEPREAAVERAAEAITAGLADYGRNHPWVAIEAINEDETYLVRTLNQAAELVAMTEHPAVGLLADVYHMHRAEGDALLDTFLRHAHLVRHVHLADGNRRIPGAGGIDLDGFLRTVKQSGYSGGLGLEPEPVTIEELASGRRYVGDLWRVIQGGWDGDTP